MFCSNTSLTLILPCLCPPSMVGRAWLLSSNDRVTYGPFTGVTSNYQLWQCSTMLRTSVNTFDNMWLDVTKCGYACMPVKFMSDLWGQSKITQIHVCILYKIIFKRCVSHDHSMLLSCSHCMGSIAVTNWLQQQIGVIWGGINHLQMYRQHDT